MSIQDSVFNESSLLRQDLISRVRRTATQRIRLKLKTAPLIDPVTLDEAKNHLRDVVDETIDNDLVKALITVATTMAEDWTRSAFIEQTWVLTLDETPRKAWLELPRGPLSSVVSVKFTTEDGIEKTFSDTLFIVDTSSRKMPGRIALKIGEVWPTDVLQRIDAFRVEYVSGYGVTRASVPAPAKHGINIIVADLYEHRESVADEESQLPEVPFPARKVLSQYRVSLL